MLTIPVITGEEMILIDKIAVESGLEIMQMMENAALAIARFAITKSEGPFLIVSGKGHNGGDGIAAARHLFNWGYKVKVLLAVEPEDLKPLSQHYYKLNEKMGVMQSTDLESLDFSDYDLVIDSLLGYNIDSNPKDSFARIINKVNLNQVRVIAIDLPSGLQATTGYAFEPCIKATYTLTLALPKTGLIKSQSKDYVGELYILDLGIPGFVYEQAGIHVDTGIFKEGAIVPFA